MRSPAARATQNGYMLEMGHLPSTAVVCFDMSEDLAFMLAARPGCYIWIGNGPTANGRWLHSARTTSTMRSCGSAGATSVAGGEHSALRGFRLLLLGGQCASGMRG